MGSKRLNLEEKEDRISALPDCLIQHILSFLPSTREAVRTGILSKRWQNQWNHVPVLIFDSDSTGMSYENFLKFIEYTLIFHNCSKIKKFHLHYPYPNKKDAQFAAKIRFATRKHVEELSLCSNSQKLLPTFIFNHASLVKLSTIRCTLAPNGNVNWGYLTTLDMIYCKLTDLAIQHILSGSPSLRSLKLADNLFDFDKLVIASKSLKILVLDRLRFNRIEISCPNLEKLSLEFTIVLDGPELFALAIENVLSYSSLLESFKLGLCSGCFYQILNLVIASKSLKRLVLGLLQTTAAALEISCPNLEQLKLFGFLKFETAKLLSFPSSLCATIDVAKIPGEELQIRRTEDILQLVQHVKHVEIGTSFLEVLSDLVLKGGLALPMLDIKCLIVNFFGLNKYPYGIASLLRNSPVLEKLVIKAPDHYHGLISNSHCHEDYDDREKLNDFGDNYWNTNAPMFNCLVSHLKTIEIISFPRGDHSRKLMLNFVQFLLKNAIVFEKMVVRLKDETTFMLKVSEELLSLPRYSRHAIIECCDALSK